MGELFFWIKLCGTIWMICWFAKAAWALIRYGLFEEFFDKFCKEKK